MDSLTSADDTREERRVEFVGLDWSAENERAERRRQATIRRKTLKQQQQQQQIQTQKQRLQEKMEDAEDCRGFLSRLATDENSETIFELEYAATVLALSRHMGLAPNEASHVDLIKGLLAKWETVVANESILDIIMAWMKKEEEEEPLQGLALDDAGTFSEEHQEVAEDCLEVESEGKPSVNASSSFEYSTDSNGPTMDQDVKESMKRFLGHSNILDVVEKRYIIKRANAADGTIVDICIMLFESLTFRAEGTRPERPQTLQHDLKVVKGWLLARSMTQSEKLFLLFTLFDEFVARYELPGVMSTVVAPGVHNMAKPKKQLLIGIGIGVVVIIVIVVVAVIIISTSS